MFATSGDGSQIYYEVTGQGDVALVLAHGWMGNVRWWDATRDAFAATHRVVALDLAGHGRSDRTRAAGSAEAYAQDILAVVRAVNAPRVVLVGHSMSGAYAALAAPGVAERLILVDTLKHLDTMPTREQSEGMLAMYRADYQGALATILPKFLFTAQTPPAVVDRLTREFSAASGDVAAELLAPLYRMDIKAVARGVDVPVRGIGADVPPGAVEANRAYFRDYDYRGLGGCGHYPMLEVPDAFDAALREAL